MFQEPDDQRKDVWRTVMNKRTRSSCEALGRFVWPWRELALRCQGRDELGHGRDVGRDALRLEESERHARGKECKDTVGRWKEC